MLLYFKNFSKYIFLPQDKELKLLFCAFYKIANFSYVFDTLKLLIAFKNILQLYLKLIFYF